MHGKGNWKGKLKTCLSRDGSISVFIRQTKAKQSKPKSLLLKWKLRRFFLAVREQNEFQSKNWKGQSTSFWVRKAASTSKGKSGIDRIRTSHGALSSMRVSQPVMIIWGQLPRIGVTRAQTNRHGQAETRGVPVRCFRPFRSVRISEVKQRPLMSDIVNERHPRWARSLLSETVAEWNRCWARPLPFSNDYKNGSLLAFIRWTGLFVTLTW